MAVLAILVFVFDIKKYRYLHFLSAILYIVFISVVLWKKRRWYVLLFPATIGVMTQNLCAAEVAFLSVMVWFI
jgi:hypothetical protein